MEWVFILWLSAATFGGPFSVEFHTQTEDGCRRLQKVVMREASNMNLKYEVEDCRAIARTP